MYIDESKIYGRHYVKIVIYPKKTLHISYDHWWLNVTDGAAITECVVKFKQRFCNVLAVEHKYSDSLPIDYALNYKRESTRDPRYDQSHTQIPYGINLHSFSLKNLSPLLT